MLIYQMLLPTEPLLSPPQHTLILYSKCVPLYSFENQKLVVNIYHIDLFVSSFNVKPTSSCNYSNAQDKMLSRT